MVIWLFIAAVVLPTFVVQYNIRTKPQLDIKNTGTTSVTIRHRSDTFVVQSGQTWHLRLRPGEALTIHAGDTTSAPSKTITLESRGLQPGRPPRIPIEVRAEGTDIHFVYAADK